jgi:hypothetical protein
MGLIGIFIGVAATEVVGIINDGEELIKKGMKRVAFSTGTMFIGDVLGISDSIDIVSSIANSDDYT